MQYAVYEKITVFMNVLAARRKNLVSRERTRRIWVMANICIPVLNKKRGMTYNEDMKFWVSNVDDYDFKIEYLKFEEGTPSRRFFPKQPMWLTG